MVRDGGGRDAGSTTRDGGHGARVSRHKKKFKNIGHTDTRHSDHGADIA